MVRPSQHQSLLTTEEIRTEPLVVGLVQPLVKYRVMQTPVNPVDAIISEDEEADQTALSATSFQVREYIHLSDSQESREYHVAVAILLWVIVEPRIAHDLGLEDWQG